MKYATYNEVITDLINIGLIKDIDQLQLAIDYYHLTRNDFNNALDYLNRISS